MKKNMLAEVDGWTPIIDDMAKQYGLIRAAVYGRMWRFCQMKDKVCRASMSNVAAYLGIDRSTVYRHVEALVKDGYLADLTPNLRNKPHIYADTGKARIKISITAESSRFETVAQNNSLSGVAQNNTSVAQNNATVAESRMSNTIKTQNKERGETTPLNNGEQLWQAALGEIQIQMRKPTFEARVKPTRVLAYEGDKFIVAAPDESGRDWLETRLAESFQRSLTGIVGRKTEVEFVVAEYSAASSESESSASESDR